MARGSVAKQNVEKMIAQAFGSNYIGNVGGKLYVWANDGGENVQIAIAMTCPKTLIEAPETATEVKTAPVTGWNFEDMPVAKKVEPAKITDEEKDEIAKMMARLGL